MNTDVWERVLDASDECTLAYFASEGLALALIRNWIGRQKRMTLNLNKIQPRRPRIHIITFETQTPRSSVLEYTSYAMPDSGHQAKRPFIPIRYQLPRTLQIILSTDAFIFLDRRDSLSKLCTSIVLNADFWNHGRGRAHVGEEMGWRLKRGLEVVRIMQGRGSMMCPMCLVRR